MSGGCWMCLAVSGPAASTFVGVWLWWWGSLGIAGGLTLVSFWGGSCSWSSRSYCGWAWLVSYTGQSAGICCLPGKPSILQIQIVTKAAEKSSWFLPYFTVAESVEWEHSHRYCDYLKPCCYCTESTSDEDFLDCHCHSSILMSRKLLQEFT